MFNYFYAFINNFISNTQFENWVYKSMNNLSENLNNSYLLYEIIECKYSDENSVAHLRKVLTDFLINNQYDMSCKVWLCDDPDLTNMIKDYDLLFELPEEVTFDCSNIDTSLKLHLRIKEVFKLPEWYGMNWHAFNDLVDLSGVRVLYINHFDEIKINIPSDADYFLKLLKNKNTKCNIVIND